MAAGRLRISGGTAKGLPLAEPRGHRLRPTSGLVREAIFNILGDRVSGSAVLDLFAGTGALGIEALSRGAASAVFVESEPAACQAILQSLARAGFTKSGRVIRGRVPAALRSLEGEFNVVFLDPPYDFEGAEEALAALGPFVAPGGTVVYEHGSRYNPPERPGGLWMQERRIYGDSAIALYAGQEGQ
ncbi:MAG: 16S rRNA (guanine(966)-N(2))-methyltransferase RsmD [Dehalococcoidia bacterium]|nr:16S rRNA (guanine(966)-N(2))-methyltransferase RsmD [Chloroflexi bacterium CFX7]MCK6564618.1 16S rRNA (guanine(966)-N(2))-methyltransferase RsmD [Dehalococcoidia bacterium]MCL4232027.1 16S rRNA (guanine(966)-N(2))-methyltransferase RsmD [Dehalococcoidia bacterium]NUQ54343.1 16S rRNA (guanine(966)-N(2))-methyltransferase RsmD [Dehalococcoidia bacterium]RIL01739.1 MAG: 16S rRNA (guanine(966)-N(2))-methyltransferase RsmD [bacterium]